MKKVFSLCLVFVLLFCSVSGVSVFASDEYRVTEKLFYASFDSMTESNDIKELVPEAGAYLVNAAGAGGSFEERESGDMALRLKSTAALDSAQIFCYPYSNGSHIKPSTGIVSVKWDFRFSGAESFRSMIQFKVGTPYYSNYLTNGSTDGVVNGNFYAFGVDTGIAYENDKWYTGEIVLDFTNKVAKVYLDGVLLGTSSGHCPANFTIIRPFQGVSQSETETSYTDYDNIQINQVEAIPGYNSGYIISEEPVVSHVFEEGEVITPALGSDAYPAASYVTLKESPALNSGEVKEGTSLALTVPTGSGKLSLRNDWTFENTYDTGIYKLSYSFYTESSYASNLVYVGQSKSQRFLTLGTDNYFYAINANTAVKTGLAYETGKWYDVTVMINIRPGFKCFDTYVNGIHLSHGNFRGDVGSFNKMYVDITGGAASENDVTLYVDDLSLALATDMGDFDVKEVFAENDEIKAPIANISAASSIGITFTNDVSSGLLAQNVALKDESGAEVEISRNYDADSKTYFITPVQGFDSSKNYTLTINGKDNVNALSDIYNQMLASDYSKVITFAQDFGVFYANVSESEGVYTASVNAVNNTADDVRITVVAGVYNGNKLVGVNFENYTVPAGSWQNITAEATAEDEATNAKIFVLSSMSTPVPVIPDVSMN